MKARILGSVINRSETAARVLNKNFEVFAWVFFMLLIFSSVWFTRGVYLFYTTGSCNGLNSSGFCVFDPAGNNNQVSTGEGCSIKPKTESDVTLKGIDLSGLPVLNPDSSDSLFMIGCYHCDYTRKAYPMVRDLVKRYGARFSFVNFPTKEDNDYFSRLGYCVNQQAPDKYWEFNDILFTGEKTRLDDKAYMDQTLTGLGLNPAAVQFCTSDPTTITTVQKQLNEMKATKFYGTPTLFIDEKAFVGPKPYRVYAIALKGLFFWLR